MKKILVWLLVMAMVFALVGCGKSAEPATEAPTTEAPAGAAPAPASGKDPKDMKIVALLPGTITDNGWNFICYDALKSICNEYMDGKEPEYIENIAVSDMAGYIRQYGEDGYDMVIIHGAQFEAAAVENAPLYPETKFCLS